MVRLGYGQVREKEQEILAFYIYTQLLSECSKFKVSMHCVCMCIYVCTCAQPDSAVGFFANVFFLRRMFCGCVHSGYHFAAISVRHKMDECMYADCSYVNNWQRKIIMYVCMYMYAFIYACIFMYACIHPCV